MKPKQFTSYSQSFLVVSETSLCSCTHCANWTRAGIKVALQINQTALSIFNPKALFSWCVLQNCEQTAPQKPRQQNWLQLTQLSPSTAR